ncbi:hypothetical protein MAALD49_35760 [Marinobacter shengliensis]|nr:hypothetical protein MAALD49_35760 [Marinobacter shengliensis]
MAIAAQAYFPDPGPLPGREAEAPCFLKCWHGEALVADFHVKAVTALLLERPGKRALHLEPVPGRAVHRRIVKPGGSKRTVPARGGNDRPVAVVRVL